jgi:hypothetical protein
MRRKDRQAVQDFTRVAARYCKIIERAKQFPRKKFIDEIGQVLPVLYTAAEELPRTKPSAKKLPPGRLSDREWDKLFHKLHRKLSSWDVYSMVFDPTKDKEAITQWLSDDLADIYRELHDFAVGAASEAALEDIVWEVKYAFGFHWGQHLTDALRVVHELRFREN